MLSNKTFTWIIHELSKQDGTAYGQRRPRPPVMDRPRMTLQERVLRFRLRAVIDRLQRQRDFNKLFAIGGHWSEGRADS